MTFNINKEDEQSFSNNRGSVVVLCRLYQLGDRGSIPGRTSTHGLSAAFTIISVNGETFASSRITTLNRSLLGKSAHQRVRKHNK